MKKFTKEEAATVAQQLNIDFDTMDFDLDQFWRGMNVELEHGTQNADTNVTNDDPLTTGKIALAHLHELPDYYDRLQTIEGEE